jgi:site-specific DNA-cytosine methylase
MLHNFQLAAIAKRNAQVRLQRIPMHQALQQTLATERHRNKPAGQCPDGPRYKALGNSFAVPVVRWIGERIAAVHGINQKNRETA